MFRSRAGQCTINEGTLWDGTIYRFIRIWPCVRVMRDFIETVGGHGGP